mgnify:CR=1 FL=1
MAEDIKPTEQADVENTESVLGMQELSTETPGDEVEAHGCVSWISISVEEQQA